MDPCVFVGVASRKTLGHFKKLSSDWGVLQIVEKWEKNVFQQVSATGERDTLANTESCILCL